MAEGCSGPGQEGILYGGVLGQMPFLISFDLEIVQTCSSTKQGGTSRQPALVKILAGNYSLLLRQVALFRKGRLEKNDL